MNIQIKASGFSLTPAIQEYVEKRLEAAGKFLADDSAAICNVEVGKTTSHHRHGDVFRAEVHLVGTRLDLYAENEAADLYVAIDKVRDEVMQHLSSDKGKRLSRARRGAARVKNLIKGLWNGGFKEEN
ncbi:MAG: ribosome-associated translation inhibitor RaiA [Patescibacteria group bacterium]|nr:ribosome-associated translation inhibitor RaiA [Patescibacteria group bacterium]